MNLKKSATFIGVATGIIAIAATLGYAFDRPVWYRSEFLPVANVVTELAAESASSKLQRAEEQKERRERMMEIGRARGRLISAEDIEDLRYWKERVRALKRRLRKLDK